MTLGNAGEMWREVQYRGDANDIRELYEKYSVGGFLETRKAEAREQSRSLRDALLKDGVLLNETLSPRVFEIVGGVKSRLGIEGQFDVVCMRDVDVNAFAHVEEGHSGTEYLVALTSAALESLNDEEIASLIGHELGHFAFGHNELLGLINRDSQNPKVTVLPYLGECLFLRWRKKSELSADRLGLIASGSFEASARALVKAGFGLSERNLNLDIDSLLDQIESIRDRPELIEAQFRSHPLLPLRLKALHLFSLAYSKGAVVDLAATEDNIDEYFSWFKRYPRKPLHEAVMRIIAIAGMKLVAAEDEIHDEEIRTILHVLHASFTDEPEKELILEPEERQRRWNESIEIVNKEGDDGDKKFIICRLADIAVADGNLLSEESGYILETAELLGIPARSAYSILVGAAQTIGFKVDYRMKEIIEGVKDRLVAESRHVADLARVR